MNARFTLKHAVLLALVAILIALNIMDVSSPAQAASPRGQTVSPTIVPAHYTGERTPETGIVSITCRNRNHFEYHNEDKTQCGDAVAVVIEQNDDSTAINQPSTPVIIDNDGVSIPSDGGSSNGGSTQHTNNGNHYGNDKPDNNAKDVKNQHNGENTAAEHHEEPKGKSK